MIVTFYDNFLEGRYKKYKGDIKRKGDISSSYVEEDLKNCLWRECGKGDEPSRVTSAKYCFFSW
jgi:hypothetical protein